MKLLSNTWFKPRTVSQLLAMEEGKKATFIALLSKFSTPTMPIRVKKLVVNKGPHFGT